MSMGNKIVKDFSNVNCGNFKVLEIRWVQREKVNSDD